MNCAIVITTFERPQLLENLLESLDGSGFPITVADDTFGTRRFMDRNWIRSVDEAFNPKSISGEVFPGDPDAVIALDDDLIVSPHYCQVMIRAFEWLLNNRGPSLVGSRDFYGEQGSKEQYLNLLLPSMKTGNNAFIHRRVWEKISPMLREYDILFGGVEHPSHSLIRAWMNNYLESVPADWPMLQEFKDGKNGTAHDAATALACALEGVPVYFTAVNRVLNCGPVKDQGNVPHNKLTGTTLDTFDQDKDLTEFRIL